MDDTKRLILALVLSGAILLGYSMFTGSKQSGPQQPPPTTTAPRQTTTQATAPAPPQAKSAAPTTAAPKPQAAPTPPPAQPARPAGEVVVDTPLYRAWFSERGGTLRKMVLKKYYQEPEQKGGKFILLNLKPSGPFSLGFNLVQAGTNLENQVFAADKKGLELTGKKRGDSLSFRARVGRFLVTKTYRFQPASYAFDLEVKVETTSGPALEVQGEISLVEEAAKKHINSYAFTGVEMLKDGKFKEMDPGDLEDNPVEAGDITWMSMNIPYFMGAVVPLTGPAGSKRSVRGALDKAGLMRGTLVEPALKLAPGKPVVYKYLLFYGPRELGILKSLGHQLDRAVDFGWFDLIAKPMLWVLNFFYSFVGNYGVAIIIITILVKLLFWPLTQKSYKSMKHMQKLQPQIAKLREKYKGDKQRLNQEIMQMYKTYKVNPMGGCLPMLVQIPVFIAFYKVLGISIELRHAPFMLWINDLSAPDRLPIGFDIPYVGHGLPVLTLLMGASMFIQQKMTPTTGDPTQAKMMMLMPVVFTVMFINFPSGLVLYWLVNNLLSIGQQYWTNKRK